MSYMAGRRATSNDISYHTETMPANMNAMGMGQQPADQGTNLLSILINVAFGFVGGLMVFIGSGEVIAYGSKLATKLIERSGYGRQVAMFGFATSAAPYIVLAPIAGIVAKQLSSVRSLKDFVYFAGAIIAGFAIAFFGQGYFAGLMH